MEQVMEQMEIYVQQQGSTVWEGGVLGPWGVSGFDGTAWDARGGWCRCGRSGLRVVSRCARLACVWSARVERDTRASTGVACAGCPQSVLRSPRKRQGLMPNLTFASSTHHPPWRRVVQR